MSGSRPDRMSYQDATFAFFDRDQFPYNVGSVGIYEGDMPFGAYLAHVERRLDRVPRYHQRMRTVPLNLGHPIWARDPAFDIRNHIRTVDLPAGAGEEELMRFAGDYLAVPLDRTRPLWEIRLVRGLTGGRTAHVAKVHHCLVDGVGGVELLGALLDVEPNPQDERPVKATDEEPADPGRVGRVVDAAFDQIEDVVDVAEKAALTVVHPTSAVGWMASVGSSLWAVRSHLGLGSKRKLWGTRLTKPRRVAWQSVWFEELHNVAAKLGGTVNDVVLTVLGGAVGRYFDYHRLDRDTALRVLIPVNVRTEAEARSLGNRVSFMLAGVPLSPMNPLERFSLVHTEVAKLKERDQPGGVDRVFSALGHLPAPLQRVMAATLRTPNFLSDLVCTNVPGPRVPLYCMGHRMVDHYPWVPIGWRMGMSLAVMSYHQKLYFSLTADQGAMADLDRLGGYLGDAFTELRDAAGVSPTQKDQAEGVEIPAPYSAKLGEH